MAYKPLDLEQFKMEVKMRENVTEPVTYMIMISFVTPEKKETEVGII